MSFFSTFRFRKKKESTPVAIDEEKFHYFFDIHEDCAVKTLCIVSVVEICRCKTVSKQFLILCRKALRALTDVNLSSWYHSPNMRCEVGNILASECGNLSKVSLDMGLSIETVIKIIQHNQKLREFVIFSWDGSYLPTSLISHIAKHNTRLETVDIRNLPLQAESAGLIEFANSCLHIKKLALISRGGHSIETSCGIETMLINFDNLMKLSLRDFPCEQIEAGFAKKKSFPNLIELGLSHCGLGNSFCILIAKRCQNLQILCLPRNLSINDNGVKEIILARLDLKVLLLNNIDVSEKTVHAIAEPDVFPNLKHFWIRYHEELAKDLLEPACSINSDFWRREFPW